MKKLNLFIATLLLSFLTCFSFAVKAPVINWKTCNIITNLDKYLEDYYMVIECGDKWCDWNWSFNIFMDNIECLPWWWSVYLIPNDIEFESLELMERWKNERSLNDKRDIRIWMLRDMSTKGDITHIYEIKQNGTWIKLESVRKYKWYDVQIESYNIKIDRINGLSIWFLCVLLLWLLLIIFILWYKRRWEEKLWMRICKRCLIYVFIIILIWAIFVLLFKLRLIYEWLQ